MVSKASEDLPEPLSPVMTVRLLRGISTSIFFRLCWRAPCTVIRSNIVRCSGNGRNLYCPASCVTSAICVKKGFDTMPHCKTCGERLHRVHRTLSERFYYMGVFECPQCKEVKRMARRFTYYLGEQVRCPL